MPIHLDFYKKEIVSWNENKFVFIVPYCGQNFVFSRFGKTW